MVQGYERRIERLEKEIQGFSEEKEKFKSIQINNDALKGVVLNQTRDFQIFSRFEYIFSTHKIVLTNLGIDVSTFFIVLDK